MTESYFQNIAPIEFEGPNTENPLAYRFYDAKRQVLGKSMVEHLRPAVCYWHTFVWGGADVFGAGTFTRPWHRVRPDLLAFGRVPGENNGKTMRAVLASE